MPSPLSIASRLMMQDAASLSNLRAGGTAKAFGARGSEHGGNDDHACAGSQCKATFRIPKLYTGKIQEGKELFRPSGAVSAGGR